MRRPSAIPVPELPKCPWLLVVTISIVLSFSFFVADHQLNFSTLNLLSLDEDLSPSPLRKLYYLAMAGMGGLLLLVPSRANVRFDSILGIVAILYGTWLGGSVLWSDNPAVSAKAVFTVGIVGICVLGVAKHLPPRDIVVVAFLASTALVLTGVLVELKLGTFRPWQGGYRFTGTIHPNEQSGVCALMCWSAWFCFRRFSKASWLFLGFSLLAFGLLFLTKSRTCLAAFLLSSAVLWATRANWQGKVAVALGTSFALAGACMYVVVMDLETGERVSAALMMGRENEGDDADLGSLNGRLPLWIATIRRAQDRPLLGYGYGAFWTDSTIQKVASECGWLAPNSHSFWIDTVLSIGLVGLIIVLLLVVVGGQFVFRAIRRSDDPTVGFIFASFVLAMITACSESDLHHPTSFVPFILGTGMARMALCRVKRRRKPRPIVPVYNNHYAPGV